MLHANAARSESSESLGLCSVTARIALHLQDPNLLVKAEGMGTDAQLSCGLFDASLAHNTTLVLSVDFKSMPRQNPDGPELFHTTWIIFCIKKPSENAIL